MKRYPRIYLKLILLLLLTTSAPTSAESLWRRRSPGHAFVLEDSRARRAGDLITILINESTEVDNRENKALRKSTGASGVFDLAAASGGGFGTGAVNGNVDLNKETDRNFSGDATYRNSREIIDRVTVTVVNVMPNGNLCLSGQRHITVAGESRLLRISGTVRPIDIGPDNTVNSRFIANMKTLYEDNGEERHFTRQGWLSRRMNRIWPF